MLQEQEKMRDTCIAVRQAREREAYSKSVVMHVREQKREQKENRGSTC